MFDTSQTPRVFGLPPGADFPAELARGLLSRMEGTPPEALARVTVLVNTRRMQRRLRALLSEGPARLLPRIGLVTDLAELAPDLALPPSVSPIRRRLDLAALVSKLIDAQPDIAPRAAIFDLADSLAALMDEMQGEGVPPETLLSLDVTDLSGHWQRSLQFLSIVRDYIAKAAGAEARLRTLAEHLVATWSQTPPAGPIIVAGSTGSRATTAMMMAAVARLPLGAVVLPGFDFDLPDRIFDTLRQDGPAAEDHPQYRFAHFAGSLDLQKSDIARWTETDPRTQRNRLVSLALRPAPVTNQWLTEGPRLGDLGPSMKNVSLIEAPDARSEALAIAAALREAVETSQTAALITPDRTLSRRVAAALLRWNIVPDDSAGRPLSLSAPGRLLRQVARLIGETPDAADVIALLKHPLAMSGAETRGPHARLTRELELHIRKYQIAHLTPDEIHRFRARRTEDDHPWCDWLAHWIDRATTAPDSTLAACLAHHVTLAEALASGTGDGSGTLWDLTAGRDALTVIEDLRTEADYPGMLTFADYRRLFERTLSKTNTRNHDEARSDVMIWGTLEARVQGADLVILGGLNEGVWPQQPDSDPWLNRTLRREAGLLLPERQIGLSAHDFQQAIAARHVILSRARRDSDSQTIPSRWVSRLTNLLDGLKDQNGPSLLQTLRDRGQHYLDIAHALDTPADRVNPQPRPAPAPPREVRPRDYSVTEIQRLIRDPYSIYARRILGLRRLDPLRPTPDARLRGTVFHKIVETAFGIDADLSDPSAADTLRTIARRHLDALPWPGVAAHWYGHMDAIADRLVEDERRRRAAGRPIAIECKGRVDLPETAFSVHGKADRIDRLTDGRLVIYDYKSGRPPSEEQIRHFDRQLPIEALMAELGGFDGVPRAEVAHVTHIGLGRTPKVQETALIESDKVDLRLVTIQRELAELFTRYDAPEKGYASRRAMEKLRYDGDYDHLARFGEWDATDPVQRIVLP